MRKVRLWLALIATLLATTAGAQSNLTVTAAEYFFDSDPGYGQATVINNVAEGELALDIPTDGLSVGTHTLYIRTKASNGTWSATMAKSIYVMTVGNSVTHVEYFFDSDPGYGKGTVLETGGLTEVALEIPTNGLSVGTHTLYIRTKASNDIWSATMAKSIYVMTAGNSVTHIEYFFDSDPGYGKGTVLETGGLTEVALEIPTTGITPGTHTLYTRTKASNGVWSATMARPIYVFTILPVAALEYFIDNDPGEGQATAVAVPTATSAAVTFDIDTSELTPGEHTLNVRAMGVDNIWRDVTTRRFMVEGDVTVVAEPYAVISENNTVLTFYYDDKKTERNGMAVGPIPYTYNSSTDKYEVHERPWSEYVGTITTVEFHESFVDDASQTSTAFWFSSMSKLTTVKGLEYLNTANVTDMTGMFHSCSSLTSLDLNGFNTAKVTDMTTMFYECSALTSLDVSGFKTENVTSMRSLFDGCSSLTSLDLSGFNTANVTNMRAMFYGCSSLIDLNISSFNTANVQEMERIFANCSSLASIQAGSASIPAEEYAKIDNPNLLLYVNEASLAPQGVQNVVLNGVAKEIVLTDEAGATDNNNFFVPQSFTAEKITYTRHFTQQTQPNVSRGWESLSLPFNVQHIVHESKGNLSPFGSTAEGKRFWLRRLAGNGLTRASKVEANVPYVISMPNSTEYTDLYNLAGHVTFSAESTTVPVTTPQTLSLTDGSIAMVPTTLRVNRSSSVWALNVGEVRGQYLEGSVFERDYRMVRPFQTYTVHYSNQPAPRFVPINKLMDDETSGIEDVRSDMEDAASGLYYDLGGRRLQGKPMQKGVYLNNGRKVIIR